MNELASWWMRAAAFALDLLVVGCAGVLIGAGVLIAEGDGPQARDLAETLSYAIGIPIGLLYAPLLMLRGGRRNGQTLGTQWLRIRVVRERGGPMGIGTGLLREVIGRQLLVAFSYGLYAVIDYLWPLWDRPRQCLHDKVAQTRVVRAGDQAAEPIDTPTPAGEQEREREHALPGGWLPPSAGH